MGMFIEDVQGGPTRLGLVIRQWNECELVETFGEKSGVHQVTTVDESQIDFSF